MKFKVGDKIKNIDTGLINPNHHKIGIIEAINKGNLLPYHIRYNDGSIGNGVAKNYQLVKTKTKMKSLTEKQLIQKGINVYKKGLVKTLKYETNQQLEYISNSKKYLKELKTELEIVKSPKISIKKRKVLRKHGYTIINKQNHAIDHIKIDISNEKRALKRYTNIKKEKINILLKN